MTLPIHSLQKILPQLEKPVALGISPPKSGLSVLVESTAPTRGSRQFLRASRWKQAGRPAVFAVAYLLGVWITLADMGHATMTETASSFSATISEVVTSASDAFRATARIHGR